MGNSMARLSPSMLLLGVVIWGSCLAAFAQLPANVVLVRGTIGAAEPAVLSIKTTDALTRAAITERTGVSVQAVKLLPRDPAHGTAP